MFRPEGNEGLKDQILQLKKEIVSTKAENHLLKVKVRKLQDEVNKREKEIETLFDPRKVHTYRKTVVEKGATMILNLKEQNEELEKLLTEKDTTIKRLNNNLQIAYAYQNDKRKIHAIVEQYNKLKVDVSDQHSEINDNVSEYGHQSLKSIERKEKHQKRSLSANAALQSVRPNSEDRKNMCSECPFSSYQQPLQEKFNSNLNKIKIMSDDITDHTTTTLTNYVQYKPILRLQDNRFLISDTPSLRSCLRKTSSPESDIERIELHCDTPHEDIQHLHLYIADMISEITQLKSTIKSMKSEQNKTKSVLTEKNSNIEQLAWEVNKLKANMNMKHVPVPCSALQMQNNSAKGKTTKISGKQSNNSITPNKNKSTGRDKKEKLVNTRTLKIQTFSPATSLFPKYVHCCQEEYTKESPEIYNKRSQTYHQLLKILSQSPSEEKPCDESDVNSEPMNE